MSEHDIVVEELLKIFILDREDDDTYVANHLGDGTWLTKNVYGGCLFAQSLVAAQKTVGSQFLPHSLHSLFILNGKLLYVIVVLLENDNLSTKSIYVNYFSLSIETSGLQDSKNP